MYEFVLVGPITTYNFPCRRLKLFQMSAVTSVALPHREPFHLYSKNCWGSNFTTRRTETLRSVRFRFDRHKFDLWFYLLIHVVHFQRLIKTPDAKTDNGFGDIDGLGHDLEFNVGQHTGFSNGFGDGLGDGLGDNDLFDIDGISTGFRYGICTMATPLPDTAPATPEALHAELKFLTASLPAPEPELVSGEGDIRTCLFCP